MFDNDDGNKSSEDILGNGPIIMFPPDTKQPDIPIVTLKSDKINVEVGEEITFDIISKIISDRSDFEKERTIQIDFD
jgi:pyruvate kinase